MPGFFLPEQTKECLTYLDQKIKETEMNGWMNLLPERYKEKNAFILDTLRKTTRRVIVEHDGSFTVVTFVSNNGGVATGVAKCNLSEDEFDPERGERIAVVRAFRNYRDKGWL